MAGAIEYRKLMTEIVYINLPGPEEPIDGMSGSELLHGFLADIYKTNNMAVKEFVNELCIRWNIRYQETKK